MSVAHPKNLILFLLAACLPACIGNEQEPQHEIRTNSSTHTNNASTATRGTTVQTSSTTLTLGTMSQVGTNTQTTQTSTSPSIQTTHQTNTQTNTTSMPSMTTPRALSGWWWLDGVKKEEFTNRCAPSENIYEPVTPTTSDDTQPPQVEIEAVVFDKPCSSTGKGAMHSAPVVVPTPGKSSALVGYLFYNMSDSLTLPVYSQLRTIYVIDAKEQVPYCFKLNEYDYRYEALNMLPIAREGKVWLMPSTHEFDAKKYDEEATFYNAGSLSLVGFDVSTRSTFVERHFKHYIDSDVVPRVVTSNGQLIVESRGHIISLSSETGETYWSFKNDIETTQIREYGQDGSILIQGGGKAAVIDRCGKQTKVASVASDNAAEKALFEQAPAYWNGALFDGTRHRLGLPKAVFSISEAMWGSSNWIYGTRVEAAIVRLTNLADGTQQTLKLHETLQTFVNMKESDQPVRIRFRSPIALDANRIALVANTDTSQYLLIHNIAEKAHVIEFVQINPDAFKSSTWFYSSNPVFTSSGQLFARHQGRMVMWSIAPGKVESPFPLGLTLGTPMNMPLPVP